MYSNKLHKVDSLPEPWDNSLDEARIQMINRNEELKNEAMISRNEAERATQQCTELKIEIEELKKTLGEEMAKNATLRESGEKFQKEIEDLKTKNEESKAKVEASVKVVNLYGQILD